LETTIIPKPTFTAQLHMMNYIFKCGSAIIFTYRSFIKTQQNQLTTSVRNILRTIFCGVYHVFSDFFFSMYCEKCIKIKMLWNNRDFFSLQPI